MPVNVVNTANDFLKWTVINGLDNPILSTDTVTDPSGPRPYPLKSPVVNVARRQDFPDEPLRAPVFERPGQLGHSPSHGRQDISLEIAAPIEEGADRFDIQLGLNLPLSRPMAARPAFHRGSSRAPSAARERS
jgi:hypothetical protein